MVLAPGTTKMFGEPLSPMVRTKTKEEELFLSGEYYKWIQALLSSYSKPQPIKDQLYSDLNLAPKLTESEITSKIMLEHVLPTYRRIILDRILQKGRIDISNLDSTSADNRKTYMADSVASADKLKTAAQDILGATEQVFVDVEKTEKNRIKDITIHGLIRSLSVEDPESIE